MKVLAVLGAFLLLGIMAAQTAEQAGPDEVKVAPQYQYADHSCFDLSVKLRHLGLSMDPADPALAGIEIQARLAKTLFEDGQAC